MSPEALLADLRRRRAAIARSEAERARIRDGLPLHQDDLCEDRERVSGYAPTTACRCRTRWT